ncbi:hypothetical protein NY547_02165 [Cnuibacter physcomitrellae]|uniref:hypothetical protein n=1 Tax=Cnuibacter physcomitrellae TaxID=1619308 RepID=UPI002175EA73|nr:hypothetical protein [Cnuibacter physcomitrellae]MCS5496044.1 hypothetical protein [Cnuibacter physcomitrellae]
MSEQTVAPPVPRRRRGDVAGHGQIVLRPRAQILAQARLVGAALTVPILAAMLWFSIPRGTWPRVVVALAFVLAIYLLGWYLVRSAQICISHDGLIERGVFRRDNRVPAKRIAAVLIVDVYRGSTAETDRQLFVVDAAGDLLLRMRGQFWSVEDMDTVSAAFGVPVRRSEDPVTWRGLRTQSPELLYWFERFPLAGGLSVAGFLALLALALILLMSPEVFVLR